AASSFVSYILITLFYHEGHGEHEAYTLYLGTNSRYFPIQKLRILHALRGEFIYQLNFDTVFKFR
ncbi:MAG: hypothetical protein AAF212_04590, partial [Verrucomicrobiota bacterium]